MRSDLVIILKAWFVKYGFVASYLTFSVRERGDKMLDLFDILFLLIEFISLMIQIKEFKNSNRTRTTVVVIIVNIKQ